MTIHVYSDNAFRSDVTTHPHDEDDALHSAVLHLYRAVHLLLHHPVKQALVCSLPAGKGKLSSQGQTILQLYSSYSKRITFSTAYCVLVIRHLGVA